MRFHPFLYLSFLLLVLTLANLLLLKSGYRIPEARARKANVDPNGRFGLRTISVRQDETSEHTRLARIQYPDRASALLLGRTPHALDIGRASVDSAGYLNRHVKLAVGIASMERKGKDYLEDTLAFVFNRTSDKEKEKFTVVVSLTDQNRTVVTARASRLSDLFPAELSSGLLQVIAPSKEIYPSLNFTGTPSNQPTYGNAPNVAEWRSKLTLDFAFLFAYSEGLSDYFLNMEDDVVPVLGFVEKSLEFVTEKTKEGPWVSLLLSAHLSIGRLYHNSVLPRLVQFMLTSFKSQPADFLMQYFDLMQMADQYQPDKYRRVPPLITHVGQISTKEQFRRKDDLVAGQRYAPFKQTNPEVQEILTTMEAYEGRTIDSAYFVKDNPYFWAKQVKKGDSIDIVLRTPIKTIEELLLISGFSPAEHRTSDKLLGANLLISEQFVGVTSDKRKAKCKKWKKVKTALDAKKGTLRSDDAFSAVGSAGIKCLRVLIKETETGWLAIKLISLVVKQNSEEERIY